MLRKTHDIGGFYVVDISDEFTVIADLQELDIYIDGLISQGKKFLAIRFEKISYIYSGAIGVLLKNLKKLKDINGEIALLEPNESVRDIIKITNLDHIFNVFQTDDDLLKYQNIEV